MHILIVLYVFSPYVGGDADAASKTLVGVLADSLAENTKFLIAVSKCYIGAFCNFMQVINCTEHFMNSDHSDLGLGLGLGLESG